MIHDRERFDSNREYKKHFRKSEILRIKHFWKSEKSHLCAFEI